MSKTRIAVLGTLSELHREPIRYDLAELESVVNAVQPDLLGVEIERSEFERNDLSRAPVEVRETLVPLSRRSAMVLVPIGSPSPDELRGPQAGLRAALTHALDATLALVQRIASDARRINSAMVSHTCGLICHLQEQACGAKGRAAWKATNERMLKNITALAYSDPGTRILVAVQCRRKHWLEPRLRTLGDVDVVNYWEL